MATPEQPARPTRELAAIMFSDIVGYTLIMGRDEREGLRALSEHRAQLRVVLPQFNGRLIGEIGDGTLSSFHSAVDAVGCARKLQATMVKDPQLRLRIGIHVGDVIFTDNTVLGDGVNIASRLNAIADPGGVCISERVYEEIRNKPEIEVKDLGEHTLKNVNRPIRVYELSGASDSARPSTAPIPAATMRRWRRRAMLAVAVGVILLVALAYGIVMRNSAPSAYTQQASGKPIRSLAVLPLENLSGDPGQEYFADGMTEELITDLAKISALRVISRTSVMRFKGEHHESLPEIAKALNVDAVVEGSVLRVGDKVRITVQLIDAAADKHLWAESYERDSHAVLALQDELSLAIAREINVELTPQEHGQLTSAQSVNPEAHEAYLKGRYSLAKWTQEGRKQGKEYFELAISIDPNFALGYEGLADYYWQAADWELPSLVAMPKARELATKALQLDDSLAEARTALGSVSYFFDFDAVAAEEQLRRAIALNPGYAEAHHVYGWLLTSQRRFEEAEAQMKEARQLDPLSPQLTADVAMPIGWSGQPDNALEWCRRALELDPGFFGAHYCLAMNYDLIGNHARALVEAQKGAALEPAPLIMNVLGYEYAMCGNRKEAEKMIEQLDLLSRQSYVSPYYLATIYLGLGDQRQALAHLAQAYQERSGTLVFMGVDRRLDSLRSDPQFKELLGKVGLHS